MPIYTYICGDCSAEFEMLEGVLSEEPKLLCPECGSKKAEKIFSAFSIGKSSRSCDSGAPACGSCCGSCGI